MLTGSGLFPPSSLGAETVTAPPPAMMRSGVKPNGVTFSEAMPWRNAAKMADDDMTVLYVYLTTASE